MSANNLAEVVAKLVDHGVPIDEIEQIIADFDFSAIEVGKEDAVANGLLRASTGEAGLSLGTAVALR